MASEVIKKPNLLILGASGGVGCALLIYLGNHRDLFDKVILIDKSKKLLSNKFIDHKNLDYVFIEKKLSLPADTVEYNKILKDNSINIVLDVSDAENFPIFFATDNAGVSYVNTSVSGHTKIHEQILHIWKHKDKMKNAVHILCSGMNPGIVNMWARYGIEKFGVPKQIIIFEYDTSKTASKTPLVTWSIRHFLEEVSDGPSAIMLGRDNVKELLPNSIDNRISMKKMLEPILKLDEYPTGFIVPHEEVVSLSQKYDIPTKFVYSINRKTMQTLIRIYEEKGKVEHNELLFGDNTNVILEGSDKVGIIMEYDDKKVYYLNSLTNIAVKGTNATYTQVVTGVIAALLTLVLDNLEKGTYFVEDLYNTYYEQYVFDKLQVQEFVFLKEKDKLRLESYNPEVRVKRRKIEH